MLHGGEGRRRSAAHFLERAGVSPEASRRAVDRFVAGAIAAAVLGAGALVPAGQWPAGRADTGPHEPRG